jgi:hypothetical protein
VLHNLSINYDEDDIPHEWYCDMKDNIDWAAYDELNLQMCAKESIVQVQDTQSTVDLNIRAIES